VIHHPHIKAWFSFNFVQTMIDHMRKHVALEALFSSGSEFRYDDIVKYARALVEDDDKAIEENMKSVRVTRSRAQQVSKKKRKENKQLLVYPFVVDEAVLSEAAADLTELGGSLFGLDAASPPANTNKELPPRRTHYTIIEMKDKDRLSPGTWLNDVIIDFWMKW
jgi:hypothetical protein